MIATFLTHLWTDDPAPNLIPVWTLQDRKSTYFRSPHGAGIFEGRTDVFASVALTHRDHGRSKRPKADDACALAGFWLDIDAPRNIGITLANLILPPTLLVNSGHGIHAWWLFEEGSWRFAGRDDQALAAQMSAQWQQLHRHEHPKLDATHDLARLMRLPGTVNGKGTPVPAELIAADGPRHRLARLWELCESAGPVRATVPADPSRAGARTREVTVPTDLATLAQRVKLMCEDETFSDTWEHRRGFDDDSLSAYDLSLAVQCAQADMTDEDIAGVIALHRRRWDPTDRKAYRPAPRWEGARSYVERTIDRARETRMEVAA